MCWGGSAAVLEVTRCRRSEWPLMRPMQIALQGKTQQEDVTTSVSDIGAQNLVPEERVALQDLH
jgi:hypothetical protein